MANRTLTIAVRDYDHTRALADGRVQVDGVDLKFVYISPPSRIFLRMLHDAKTPDTRAKRIARILDIVSNRMTFSDLLRPKTASRARDSAPSRRPR